jgi:DNA adenine methylase
MIKSPFPYFGGKSKVTPLIWKYLGDVDNFVDPFMGSLAVLLGRPENHSGVTETVNDIDSFLCNFWRATKYAPDEVAQWADYPITETDLHARHLWLVNEGRERIANLTADPDACDAKVAGWWLWGICIWIGSGWCSGDGPWQAVDGKLVDNRKLPHLGDAGQGINRKLPHLGTAGQGINRKRPHLGDAGQGINRKRQDIYAYMQALSDRLRNVRVCCGDWQRVVTNGALSYGATVGVFLDPPYAASTGRDMSCYNHETEVSAAVGEWARAHGDNPRLRIALAGYDGEHVMPDTWTKIEWTAGASYKSSNGDLTGNRHLERIWFSPHCIRRARAAQQLSLDTGDGDGAGTGEVTFDNGEN